MSLAARPLWSHVFDAQLHVRQALGMLDIREMKAGIAPGLRFCAGPANPQYEIGSNELPVQRALAAHLRAGMTFFDIGANVGFFSVLGAHLVGPGGHVFAFEPVREMAAHICLNARLNGLRHITVVERAVTHTTGKATLLLANYAGGAALEHAGAPPDLSGARTVGTLALDEAIERGALPVPNVLKVDVEGAELEVLKSATHLLSARHPIVVLEVDAASDSEVNARFGECESLLRSLGYDIEELENSYPAIQWRVRHILAKPMTT